MIVIAMIIIIMIVKIIIIIAYVIIGKLYYAASKITLLQLVYRL